MKHENMDAKRDYVLDMIIRNLEDVNNSLDKLTRYTNDEVSHIKIELMKLTEEIRQMKEHPCPRDASKVREIIETERLKYEAKRPKEKREIILWVVAVVGGTVSIMLGLYTLLK